MRIVGYCEDCQIPLCQKEVGVPCRRCGKMNEKEEDLKRCARPPAAKQTGKELGYGKKFKGTAKGPTYAHNVNARKR